MNSTGQFFPVRPKPLLDEWFIGYVLRVAYRNGRYSLNEFCRTIGMPHRKTNYDIGHPQNVSFVKACSEYLRQSPQALQESFSDLSGHVFFDEHRLIRDTRVTQPKICPCCIEKHGYLKAEWQVAHVTHCAEHSVMLLDCCPRCSTPFKWSGELFEQCPSCETPWKELDAPVSAVPVYQSAKGVHTSESLRALYAALLFTLRPHDLMFDSVQTLHLDNTTLHQHLLQAHALLTDSCYRKKWFSDYAIDSPYYPICDGISLDVYLQRLVDGYGVQLGVERAHVVPVDKHEIQSVVRKPRQALASHLEDLNRQVGLVEASAYLGLSSNELMELVEIGHLKTLNSPRVLRDILFDVSDVSSIEKRLYARTGPASGAGGDQLVPLHFIFSKLKYFCMSRAQLVDTLLRTKSVRLYSDQESGKWQDIQVHEHFLLSCLDEVFIEQLPEAISAATFRSMCGLSGAQLQTLITNSDLCYAGWHETDQIKADVARLFFEQRLLLNRLAKLYGFDLKSTYLRLIKLGVAPVFAPQENKPVVVYSRSSVTLCTVITILNAECKSPPA